MARRYRFRRVSSGDLPLLEAWQRLPHVAEWWDGSTVYDAEDLTDPRLALWLVEYDGRPFAFMQDYDVHGWPDHHFSFLPPGARGIDQFIADPAMVGIGHGSAFIRARLEELFDAGVPAVGTDPHPDNARAIAAYRKAGFSIVGGPVDSEWGPSLLMECRG